MPLPPPDIAAIKSAHERIQPAIHRTPILTSRCLDEAAGRQLFFKCEHLQRVGAFKFRGAQNAVQLLSQSQATHGVITHSSGNHAQALALAAALRQIKACVIMPRNAPKPKINATRGYGADIVFCDPTTSERDRVMRDTQKESNATFIPPYDHPHIIAGQGTIGLELHEQVPNLEAVITPVGGGGLLSGVALCLKSLNPAIRVYGAEPKGADDAARSLALGRIVPMESPQTIADGLLTSLGQHTWPIIQERVDTILTVTEEEIIQAMRLMWERTKQLIEPSAAVAVAAALSQGFRESSAPNRVAVVLSGGNCDVTRLPW